MVKLKDIVFLEQARNDIIQGREFYDRIEQGIGQYFFDTLISDVESLNVSAGVHEKHFGLFRLQSKRFPYFVYYKLKERVAIIVAVLDARQKPSHIIERLN